METEKTLQTMQIEEVFFNSLEGSNQAFEEATMCMCCGPTGMGGVCRDDGRIGNSSF